MQITYAPKGILQIDDCRIIYRNFAGRGSKYNREGDRNFAIVIPDQEPANELIDAGWNVKIKPPRNEDEDPFMYLPVKVKFNVNGPNAYLASGRKMTKLDDTTIGILDDVNISSVDLDIRPFDWVVNDKTGRSAYLQSIKVTQRIDRFAAEMEEYKTGSNE